jgi:hypothetical protein
MTDTDNSALMPHCCAFYNLRRSGVVDFLVANIEKASVLLLHFLEIADVLVFRFWSCSLDCFLSISKSEGPLVDCGAERFFPLTVDVELTPLSGALLATTGF